MWEVFGKKLTAVSSWRKWFSLFSYSFASRFPPIPLAFQLLAKTESSSWPATFCYLPSVTLLVFWLWGVASPAVLGSHSTHARAQVPLVLAHVPQLPSYFVYLKDLLLGIGTLAVGCLSIASGAPCEWLGLSQDLSACWGASAFFVSAFVAGSSMCNGNSVTLSRLLLSSTGNAVDRKNLPPPTFFSPHPWHVEVAGPGIEPAPQQWCELLRWQHWVLNLLSHMATPRENLSSIPSPSWGPHLRHSLGFMGPGRMLAPCQVWTPCFTLLSFIFLPLAAPT